MEVEAVENGPIVVRKDNGENIRLCRCGKTKTSPYCDDSHYTARRGFAFLKIEDEEPSKNILEESDIQYTLVQNIYGDEFLVACNCDNYACNDSGCECHCD